MFPSTAVPLLQNGYAGNWRIKKKKKKEKKRKIPAVMGRPLY
jgi:hypothetical protein